MVRRPPALHPCRHEHLGAGATGLAKRGQQGSRADRPTVLQCRLSGYDAVTPALGTTGRRADVGCLADDVGDTPQAFVDGEVWWHEPRVD